MTRYQSAIGTSEVFIAEQHARLPEHSEYDIYIELDANKKLPVGRLYPLARDELDLLKDYLDEMVKYEKIRPAKSPAGAPIFFAKQAAEWQAQDCGRLSWNLML